ncbi:hypothetical protein TWF694_006106 [Orbilia ellipsospora]|uniref:Uncharacterized protein n=1 Tax=Orbilia ellipsospora TaxID=2528407 RepID=A0AAV9WRB1_9PEZI
MQLTQILSIAAVLAATTASAYSVPDSYIGVVRRGTGSANSTASFNTTASVPAKPTKPKAAKRGVRFGIAAVKVTNSTTPSNSTISTSAKILTDIGEKLPGILEKQTGDSLKTNIIDAIGKMPVITPEQTSFFKDLPQKVWDQMSVFMNNVTDTIKSGHPDQKLMNQNANAWVDLFNKTTPDFAKLSTTPPADVPEYLEDFI